VDAMAEVSVVTATWTGFTGEPGTTRLAFQPATDPTSRQQIVDAARAFFASCTTLLKSGWQIQVSEIVQNYDILTSQLLTEVAAGTRPPVVNGTVVSSAIFVGGAGMEIKWGTGVVWQGHKVVGRTFLVPAANFSEADGTPLSASMNQLITAGNILINAAGPDFSIWSKRFDRSVKPFVQVAGALTGVTSCSVRNEVAQLKSRRH
jgi:hypothetical protein